MKRGTNNRRRSNTTTILAIIIGLILFVAVLASVVIFFSGGVNLGSDSGNTETPDPISVQCERMCDTGQRTGFCDIQRTTSSGSAATCEELANSNQYQVESCPNIDCNKQIDKTCVSGLGSEWKDPTSEGECPDNGIKRTSSDSPPESGQVCCFYP